VAKHKHLALQAGFDVKLNRNWSINVDVKKVQIRSDVYMAGEQISRVKPDPVLIGVGLGYRFRRNRHAAGRCAAASATMHHDTQGRPGHGRIEWSRARRSLHFASSSAARRDTTAVVAVDRVSFPDASKHADAPACSE
jgi:hypothetical protein